MNRWIMARMMAGLIVWALKMKFKSLAFKVKYHAFMAAIWVSKRIPPM